ncbi:MULTISPECIES: ABC transporter permease subunit [unclassified Sphingomonas]|uniref:ABC transporter permease n=2 Tax=unclassified Sphingomonas TaxID=196159 RepID=UPI000E725E6D|nr:MULTISPECIES: ABC transporter permease subunit [unclassified Sphingomonas]RKE54235.1 NitT/TauT family transport system permease protein [Sphingomonas sp. PP-CC-1A-547]TCM00053.1 NitT/TauT family transport system permease protein [Sphingomonas sp. PP-CC-3G-468]
MDRLAFLGFSPRRLKVGMGWSDLAVFAILLAVAVGAVSGVRDAVEPLARLRVEPIVLDPWALPQYALLTTLRLFAALAASFVFTIVAATAAAKSRRAELVIIPALDILQSVPVLGFMTFTVTAFMGLFPGSRVGVECAAIFAIFTSQAWNMAFSLYQSLRQVPGDLDEVARGFGLSPLRKLLRVELPFAAPGLIWNAMMSMSGGWFFVVASEAISVGHTQIMLPGIGSWLAVAIDRRDLGAVAMAVAAMAVVILLYDQLVFRPVIAWADRFRVEQTASSNPPKSWVFDLFRRARLLPSLTAPLRAAAALVYVVEPAPRPMIQRRQFAPTVGAERSVTLRIWTILVVIAALAAAAYAVRFLGATLTLDDAWTALRFGLLTLFRVIVLIAVASLIWVPIGVWIGLRPVWTARVQPVAQFLAAFPANVLFPIAVVAIVHFHANPDIWLSPLMVLGTQWYILFNVIAGASAIPNDLREAHSMFGVRGWLWWRRLILPGIFPYYITGALTASGGSWNASIVAEAVSWGSTHLRARGLGSYIADATAAGDGPKVLLGIMVMSVFVIAINRLLFRPLYKISERRLRLS